MPSTKQLVATYFNRPLLKQLDAPAPRRDGSASHTKHERKLTAMKYHHIALSVGLAMFLAIAPVQAQTIAEIESRVDSLQQEKMRLKEQTTSIESKLNDAHTRKAALDPYEGDLISAEVKRTAKVKDSPTPYAKVLGEVEPGTYMVSGYDDGGYYHVVSNSGSPSGWVLVSQVRGNDSLWTMTRKVRKQNKIEEKARKKAREKARKRRREEIRVQTQIGRDKRHNEMRDKGYSIELGRASFTVNSAGGVQPYFQLANISKDKQIKYLTFTVKGFNSVGDLVRDQVGRGGNTHSMRAVGPIEPGEDAAYRFDPVWYNGTTDCMELHKILVEHVDGSTFTYINDLKDISQNTNDVRLRGDCSL